MAKKLSKMEMNEFILIDSSNIKDEHICCAFSDKKCEQSYLAKKNWLNKEFENAYVFRRLDERAKVFMEYGFAEKAWIPVYAPDYLMIGCFWVSGKYKGQSYGKKLLHVAIEDAKKQGKLGLVTVVGKKKYHFMSDGKWFLKQGFETVQTTETGFSLLALNFDDKAEKPRFLDQVLSNEIDENEGISVYYSNRCPYSEYHVETSLRETAKKRGLALKVIKLTSFEEAQSAPTPATIFSLYFKGRFITTDISICMESRFDKLMSKSGVTDYK